MSDNNYWLLPEGITEALPDDAARLEALRRQLIDLYATWGYQLVMPPLVEFMESLSTGTGKQLDLQTFKLTDQLSGRLMGLRADITPQVARIDAHRMRVKYPNRLCYMGPVLRTRSNHSNGGSRSPLQIGAELFGHAGIDSDCEVISLAIETLRCSTDEAIILDMGHVGVFSQICLHLNLSSKESDLFSDMLERKSIPEIESWVASKNFTNEQATIVRKLPDMDGGIEVLDQAYKLLASVGSELEEILQYWRELAQRLASAFDDVRLHIDFAELRGYAYHTGIMFQLYLPSIKREVIRGGRYDGIGRAFGNARPATGFSADLRMLNTLAARELPTVNRILAPAIPDHDLEKYVRELRNQGHIVIRQLADNQLYTARDLGCDQEIVKEDNHWAVTNV